MDCSRHWRGLFLSVFEVYPRYLVSVGWVPRLLFWHGLNLDIVITQVSWNRPWFFLDWLISREGIFGRDLCLSLLFLGSWNYSFRESAHWIGSFPVNPNSLFNPIFSPWLRPKGLCILRRAYPHESGSDDTVDCRLPTVDWKISLPLQRIFAYHI